MTGASAGPVILPAPRTGRWIGLPLIALFLAWLVWQILRNPGFQWRIVGHYMLAPDVLSGVAMTIALTALVMVCGATLGIGLALMRMSGDALLS